MSERQCECDGRYIGCEHGRRCLVISGGGRWSPYFCPDCDRRRVDHISANLAEIKASFGNVSDDGETR